MELGPFLELGPSGIEDLAEIVEKGDLDDKLNDKAATHGTRICIKRKKITYGKFFDFCAEKCVYN